MQIASFKGIYEQVVAEHEASATFVVKAASLIAALKPIKIDDNSKLAQQWKVLLARKVTKARK